MCDERRSCLICAFDISEYEEGLEECGACASMLGRESAYEALRAYIADRGSEHNILTEALDLMADLNDLIAYMQEGLWESPSLDTP